MKIYFVVGGFTQQSGVFLISPKFDKFSRANEYRNDLIVSDSFCDNPLFIISVERKSADSFEKQMRKGLDS